MKATDYPRGKPVPVSMGAEAPRHGTVICYTLIKYSHRHPTVFQPLNEKEIGNCFWLLCAKNDM